MKNNALLIPPNFFYLCIILNVVIYFLLPKYNTIPAPYNYTGLILIILGFWIVIDAYKLFKKVNTPENFTKSTAVVTTGLYRYSRNPMYVGSILVLVGLAIVLTNPIGFVTPILMFAILNWMFISFEEEKMTKEIGKDYIDYKKKVRRWV